MGQITAAGRLPPAKVLVIGAGVAGLSAIASAKNLGAVVRCFGTRPATKEQVESLGGQFLTVSLLAVRRNAGRRGRVAILPGTFILLRIFRSDRQSELPSKRKHWYIKVVLVLRHSSKHKPGIVIHCTRNLPLWLRPCMRGLPWAPEHKHKKTHDPAAIRKVIHQTTI